MNRCNYLWWDREKTVIDDCLYKIEKETPRSRGYYTVQGLILYRYQEIVSHTRLEYEGDCTTKGKCCIHELRSDSYKMRVQRILRTTRVVRDKIFICIQNICIYGTEWKIIWVLGDKMGVRAGTASQFKTWWSVEDFDYTVNALNNCYKCNTGGHVRKVCGWNKDE